MKAIMVMFDSLNRRMLEPYGCDVVHTPNFRRLAERTVTFDNAYVGSMPCMPARRELHTGRYNFLHASWGPIEPFDDSMPEILKRNGIYSHLISDHYHYWEDGGATYHSRYSSWEMVRGQEYDPWKPAVKMPEMPETVGGLGRNRHYWTNRAHMPDEKDHYQTQTFDNALAFLEHNHDADNWFLHVETFDPHEPYFAPERFRDLYPKSDGKYFDWPPYRAVKETPEEVERCRLESASPLFEYKLMPTEHGTGRAFMPMEMLATAELADPFSFTKGLKTLKVDARARPKGTSADHQAKFPTALYDLEKDSGQKNGITDLDLEARMCGHIRKLMKDNDAPPEQWVRLGLNP